MQSRLRREEAWQKQKLLLDLCKHVAFYMVVAVVMAVSVAILGFSRNPSLQSQASTAMMTVMAGLAGHIAGKSAK